MSKRHFSDDPRNMLPLFISVGACWSEKLLTTVSYIVMQKMGKAYQANLSSVFLAAGDTDLVTHPARIGAWMSYVERPPFNFHGFNHWHFKRTPYNPTSYSPIPDQVDNDNVVSNVIEMSNDIYKGTTKRSWPLAFSMKVLFAGVCDIHTPLHLTEYFSSDFPVGDQNGRLFNVNYNNQKTTLFNLYETGCGLDNKLQATYDTAFWNDVKELADELLEDYNFVPKHFSQNEINDQAESTYDYTVKNIYSMIKPNEKVSDEMINECQTHTKQMMRLSAERLVYILNGSTIHAQKVEKVPYTTPLSTSEMIAWSLMFILAPYTGFLIWKKHCAPNTSS